MPIFSLVFLASAFMPPGRTPTLPPLRPFRLMKTVRNLKNLFCSPHTRPFCRLSISRDLFLLCKERKHQKLPFSLRIYLATWSNLECLRFCFKGKTKPCGKQLRQAGYFHSFISPSVSLSNQKVIRRWLVCHERLFPRLFEMQTRRRHGTKFLHAFDFISKLLLFASTRYYCIMIVCCVRESRWSISCEKISHKRIMSRLIYWLYFSELECAFCRMLNQFPSSKFLTSHAPQNSRKVRYEAFNPIEFAANFYVRE